MNAAFFYVLVMTFSGWQMDDYQDITNDVNVSRFEELKNYVLTHGTHSPHRIYDTQRLFVSLDSLVLYVTGRNVHGEFLEDPNTICILNKHYASGTTTYYTLFVVKPGDTKRKDLSIPTFMKEQHVYLKLSTTEKSDGGGALMLRNKLIPFILANKRNVKKPD
jgi:hypothetical protein